MQETGLAEMHWNPLSIFSSENALLMPDSPCIFFLTVNFGKLHLNLSNKLCDDLVKITHSSFYFVLNHFCLAILLSSVFSSDKDEISCFTGVVQNLS